MVTTKVDYLFKISVELTGRISTEDVLVDVLDAELNADEEESK